MKHLVFGLMFAAIALAQHPKVSDCFKVHELLRADEEHYWATWTNTCPYTIDAVYVMVRFADRSAKDLADGVWALHFIAPGAHRTMRFSAPGKLTDFASVHQRKITGDIGEAFGRDVGPVNPPMTSVEMAAVSAYTEAIVKEGGSRTRGTTVSAIIGDSGEGAYRSHPATESALLKEVLANSAVAQAAPAIRPVSLIGDPGEASFRSDFPDPWRAVLSAQESAVSPAPRPSFVRFFLDDKPIFQ
jgi:hypothetical protein